MTPDTPVHTIDECFEYLKNNAWQFPMLPPDAPVKINAQMLRSLYFHIGCLKFGVRLGDDIEALGEQLKRLGLEEKMNGDFKGFPGEEPQA